MKMKTKSGAKKRFKLTGSGKFKHKKPNLRHILTKKASKRKRKLSQLKFVDITAMGTMRRFFPYAH